MVAVDVHMERVLGFIQLHRDALKFECVMFCAVPLNTDIFINTEMCSFAHLLTLNKCTELLWCNCS
jgi:hypothetical protein